MSSDMYFFRSMCRRVGAWMLPALCLVSLAHAQELNWAEKMFDRRSMDFGVVAKHTETRVKIAIKNIYLETVHISSVTSSCGCTAAKPSQDTIPSLQTAYIDIVMDTHKFEHEKKSRVSVHFDQPFSATVEIPVQMWVRSDVSVEPGAAKFESVSRGTTAERRLAIAYTGGRPDWRIKDVIRNNPALEVKLFETGRNLGRVTYELVVSVRPTAPIGAIHDKLVVVTDDPTSPQIPIEVEAKVSADFGVSPDVVFYGNLSPGEKKTISVTVHGKRPFIIEKIESEKTAGVFEVRIPAESRPVHVLPLTVIAPEAAGPFDEEFTLSISGRKETLTFKATGKVVAPSQVSTTLPK